MTSCLPIPDTTYPQKNTTVSYQNPTLQTPSTPNHPGTDSGEDPHHQKTREITVEHAHKVLLPPCDEARHTYHPCSFFSPSCEPHWVRLKCVLSTFLSKMTRFWKGVLDVTQDVSRWDLISTGHRTLSCFYHILDISNSDSKIEKKKEFKLAIFFHNCKRHSGMR